jgi:hypothetical protein
MANTRTAPVNTPRKLRLRVSIVSPPAGTRWALQLGKSELVPPARTSERSVVFELDAEMVSATEAEPVRLRGAAIQGRPGDRFLYLNSGTYAGDRTSIWSRRAKVPLIGITASLAKAAAHEGAVLECQFSGTAKDGGPACASITLLSPGWTVT